jgi:hypothetical protein
VELIDFAWGRCVDGNGFRIVSKRPRKPPAWTEGPKVITLATWTVKGAPDAAIATIGKRQFELYRPTNFPALFQHFADLPATAAAMCDFFNEFGPLEFAGGSPLVGPTYCATNLGGVLAHHAALCRAIDLFQAGDLSSLAQRYNVGWGQLRTELRPQPDGNIAVVFVPSSLIQFLWLQLALHAASNAKLLRCEHCGIPFRVGTGTGRRDTAKFCSNACKVAAFRERHGGRTVNA